MVVGEVAIAFDTAVANIAVDSREEFDCSRPVFGPQGCLQRAGVRKVHGRDTPLRDGAGAPGRIPEAELADQFGLSQIQNLAVGQQVGRVDIEPVAAVDAKLQRLPVR